MIFLENLLLELWQSKMKMHIYMYYIDYDYQEVYFERFGD